MRTPTPETVAQQYLQEIRTPFAPLTAESVRYYANQSLKLFFDHVQATGEPLAAAIDVLCEINHFSDHTLARIGLEALFPNLIEKLNDAFNPAYSKLYDRLFSQVISFARGLKEGTEFDLALTHLGLPSESALLTRKADLTNSQQRLHSTRPLQKILFLSRITIGADVAITGVVLSHLKRVFPSAELVLIGHQKLTQLFGGDLRLRVKPIFYGRSDTLQSRLNSWLELLAIINDEIRGLTSEDFCLIDPDSRLTQLGLLPLLPLEYERGSYFFFDSRSFSRPGSEKLGELTSVWINEITSTNQPSFPFLSLPAAVNPIGFNIIRSFSDKSDKPFACLSFGCGGNPKKRVSHEFEAALVAKLSQSNRLFIDCGASDEENEQTQRLLSSFENRSKKILLLNEASYLQELSTQSQIPDIICWQGGIGSFASLISNCHLYVGYDSSGQHLAAAAAVPSQTFFVNSGSATFAKRWHPFGKAPTHVTLIEPSQLPLNHLDINNLLQRI
jgi:ADP-heptose:LPS heptosyltransferase